MKKSLRAFSRKQFVLSVGRFVLSVGAKTPEFVLSVGNGGRAFVLSVGKHPLNRPKEIAIWTGKDLMI